MIILDFPQRSDEWYAARLGLPTASAFENILTATGKAPTPTRRDNYLHLLLAEWLSGGAVETYQNQWMQRGIELEQEAADAYAFISGAELQLVGFCLHDSKQYGCSPDSLTGEKGLVEIKCPAPHTHVEYLLGEKIPTKYIPQVQGQLLVTGREWLDFVSYHPKMEPFIVRVLRDDKYIALLEKQLSAFNGILNTKKDYLINKGYRPFAEAA